MPVFDLLDYILFMGKIESNVLLDTEYSYESK